MGTIHYFLSYIGRFLQSNVHIDHFVSLCKEAEGARQEDKPLPYTLLFSKSIS